jgi:hypothetical protein
MDVCQSEGGAGNMGGGMPLPYIGPRGVILYIGREGANMLWSIEEDSWP